MIAPKYTIGSIVWWATTETERKYIQCSDCFGKKYIKVELADDDKTVLTIPCEGCTRGYEWPSGLIETWEAVVSVKTASITGVNLDHEGVEYRSATSSTSSYILKEEDLFENEDEAKARAEVIAAERTEAEAARHRNKLKPTKSWAWHVTYHRNCLKRAEKEVEYHTSQMNHAKTLAKAVQA